MYDRFRFRVWLIKENCYNHQEPFPTCCMQENGLLAYFHEEKQMQNYIVEQCTGLRDINGNLIYAGDRGILTVFGGICPNGGYVDSEKQVNVRVEWVDECAGFYFVDDNGIYYDMTNSTESFEIVGNIHEREDKQ